MYSVYYPYSLIRVLMEKNNKVLKLNKNCNIFSFLGWDLNPDEGYGSTEPIESGILKNTSKMDCTV